MCYPFGMEREFKYSPKVTFREGDKMRVSGGPYYPLKDGRKINMGERGTHTFSHVDKDGNVWARKDSGTLCLIYMGKEHVSETTGTHFCPHKLVKVRKK